MAYDPNDFVLVERAPEDRHKCAGTPRRATNPRTGGRPARGTAGTNPRTGQAAVVLFNFVRVFCLCIAFEGDLSEVVYAVGGTSIPQVYPRGVGGRGFSRVILFLLPLSLVARLFSFLALGIPLSSEVTNRLGRMSRCLVIALS